MWRDVIGKLRVNHREMLPTISLLTISTLFLIAFFDPTFGKVAAAIGQSGDATTAYRLIYTALHLLPLAYGIYRVIVGSEERDLKWWRAVLLSASIITVLALPGTLLADLLSGPAGGSGLLHHLCLISLLFAALRSISRERWWSHANRPTSLLLPPLLASLWSLGVMTSAATGAYFLADGQPYCIATPDHRSPDNPDYGPISSWQELRGSELATEMTGYKDTSRWYFHAVLVTRDNGSVHYWNWSFSRFRWDEAHPGGSIPSAASACEPQSAFLSDLAFVAP